MAELETVVRLGTVSGSQIEHLPEFVDLVLSLKKTIDQIEIINNQG